MTVAVLDLVRADTSSELGSLQCRLNRLDDWREAKCLTIAEDAEYAWLQARQREVINRRSRPRRR